MSSPLDGRIRKMAREEASALLGAPVAANSVDPGRIAALEKEVAELRTVMQRLDARLDAIEKATGQTDQEASRPAMRRTRKTGE